MDMQNGNIEHMTNTAYSKLVWWEIYNFMSIPYAKCEFDERGVINIKGYNDSGKSNVIRALDVALNNRYPTNQVKFIRDDEDFFDIRVGFSDGAVIRKIKYTNGKGLYEMYRGNDMIYSTKQNGVLTPVTGVPQVIQDYLGLISYGDIFLNSRACYEKQLLVETSGGENYKFLNTILHSEELALASKLLNTDKNAVLAEKNKLEVEIQSLKAQIAGIKDITLDLVESLIVCDRNLDLHEEQLGTIETLLATMEEKDSINVLPSLNTIDLSQLEELSRLEDLSIKSEAITILPELKALDTTKIDLLSNLVDAHNELSVIEVYPKLVQIDVAHIVELDNLCSTNKKISEMSISPRLDSLDNDILNDVTRLAGTLKEIEKIDNNIKENEELLKSEQAKLDALAIELKSALDKAGIKSVKCPKCGEVVEVA